MPGLVLSVRSCSRHRLSNESCKQILIAQLGKSLLKSRKKIFFDMQAKNMLTELQTTEGSAVKIILIQR